MRVCTSCGRESAEDFAFCPHCGAPFAEAAPSREQRKVVTVLFCDVTGSTELGEQLDPEALRALLGRYFERMSATVERHGGTVEKFIGDAVMAVFGVPVVHEDDALRAVRAAVEMREAFPELGIQGRIGVTTGEVVTGTEERLATGDAVNVAARLEQAAQPGEILIGEETLGLARDAVEVEAVEPLELKGKSELVVAYRLVSVAGEEGFTRQLDAPMVGRERELDRLRDAFDQAVRDSSCQLFTILGPAGVGKSRLVAEFLDSPKDALVARGRCLPYGEGITYWPVVEVVKQLPHAEVDPVAADTIQALVGDQQLVSSSEEIAWAFRKLLEAVATEQPLVCVFDDVHWGEETFLDLVEHVADLSRDAPILLLCMARPELLDRRAGWAGGKVNATSVLLEPLGIEETERLIESLAHLDEGLRVRILEAAEGNPLFVEEMVALVQESGDGEIAVPPTIQALLAARLDQLDSDERDVLQRGAVEGRIFHRGAVQALAPEESHVVAHLTSLVRKELVRPDKTQFAGEDAFRFRHLLIRDAAYDALPKAIRAELHQRFAAWLEQHGAELIELDEILGYHLEQAARYRAELATPDATLATAAADHLATAGRRAHLRGDLAGAANQLERSLQLTPARDVVLEVELSEALFWSGNPAEAEEIVADAAARAEASGDEQAAMLTRLVQLTYALHTSPNTVDALRALAEEAMPVFEQAGDNRGLMRAWMGIGQAEHSLCHFAARNEAHGRALEYAKLCGDERTASQLISSMSSGYVFGPTSVEEGLRWCESHSDEKAARHGVLAARAVLEAMGGRFDEAHALAREAYARMEELGQDVACALMGEEFWYVEMRAGDPEAAERALRKSCAVLEEMGATSWLSTQAAELGDVLCVLGRYDEAEEWARKSRELGASDDIVTQIYWRQLKARVHAHRGEFDQAERLAREAVEYGKKTDMLVAHGGALLDWAEVLELAGRREEAAQEVQKALELFERKGDLPMAGQARARLQRLL